MKKLMLIAVLLAATVVQPGWAAGKAKGKCLPASAMEAEQALRFMTQLGIASNACTTIGIYADFRMRNRDAIVTYQQVLMTHLHGAKAFDRWNTALANQLAQRQSSVTPAMFCEQSVPLLQQAKALDSNGFRAYAAAQAATLRAQTPACAK